MNRDELNSRPLNVRLIVFFFLDLSKQVFLKLRRRNFALTDNLCRGYDFKTKFHRKKYRGYFEYWEETVQTTNSNNTRTRKYTCATYLFFSIKNYSTFDRNTWKIKN